MYNIHLPLFTSPFLEGLYTNSAFGRHDVQTFLQERRKVTHGLRNVSHGGSPVGSGPAIIEPFQIFESMIFNWLDLEFGKYLSCGLYYSDSQNEQQGNIYFLNFFVEIFNRPGVQCTWGCSTKTFIKRPRQSVANSKLNMKVQSCNSVIV